MISHHLKIAAPTTCLNASLVSNASRDGSATHLLSPDSSILDITSALENVLENDAVLTMAYPATESVTTQEIGQSSHKNDQPNYLGTYHKGT